jgi:hypothetical protein
MEMMLYQVKTLKKTQGFGARRFCRPDLEELAGQDGMR